MNRRRRVARGQYRSCWSRTPLDNMALVWPDMAMSRVGVAELKNNLSRHLRAVQTGEEIDVTDHDRPIARLVPVGSGSRMNLRAPARPFAAVRDRAYEPLQLPFDPLEILYDDRRKR